jgi:hypothetical protein
VFEEIPERLVNFVRDHLTADSNSDRNLAYLEAAGGVIREYTGKAVFKPEVEGFFNAGPVNPAGDFSFRYPVTVIRLAESIFALRNCPGFQTVCDRFQKREVREVFFEATVARYFVRRGAIPHFRPEIGKKTADFDFYVIADDETINVEVTALTAPSFSAATLQNALEAKMKQLPKIGASTIFCVIPESWSQSGVNLDMAVTDAVNRLFRLSRRVNVVTFVQEHTVSFTADGTRGAYRVVLKPFKNLRPRTPTSKLDFLFEDQVASSAMQEIFRNPTAALTNPELMVAAGLETRGSDFFRWVDTLRPRANVVA